jgi:hypothetical protein
MVGRRFQPAHDGAIDTGIDRRAGNDLVEQIGADAARAR